MSQCSSNGVIFPQVLSLTCNFVPAEIQHGNAMMHIVKNCKLNVLNQNTFWPKYIDKPPNNRQQSENHCQKYSQTFSRKPDVFQEFQLQS